MQALPSAGIKYVVFVAKHHDGFCLWPSKYTEHCVKNSSWHGGQGDVVRATELATGRQVALKVLRPDLLGSAEDRGRFRRFLYGKVGHGRHGQGNQRQLDIL
jgi:hypothetical protein